MTLNPTEQQDPLEPKATPSFNIKLKAVRPMWKDVLSFCLSAGLMWMGTHVALNFGAYAQIAKFRVGEAASILSNIDVFSPNADARQNDEITASVLNITLPQSRYSKQEKTYTPTVRRTAQKAVFADMPIYPSDNRIVIPRINKSVPLVNVPDGTTWDGLEDAIQEALRGGVAVHPISRDPDVNGNFFLTGHSSYYVNDPGKFKDTFALLHEMEVGDMVEVYWKGKKYEYEIEQEFVVTPEQVEILAQPRDKKMLTLMTCTPIGTANKRLILTAKPVKKSEVRGVKVN